MSLRKYGLILLLAAVVIVSGCSQPSGQATGQGQAQPTTPNQQIIQNDSNTNYQTTNDNDVSELRTKVNVLETSLSNTRTELQNTKNELAQIQTSYSNTKVELESTKNEVTQLQANIQKLQLQADSSTAYELLRKTLTDPNILSNQIANKIISSNDILNPIKPQISGIVASFIRAKIPSINWVKDSISVSSGRTYITKMKSSFPVEIETSIPIIGKVTVGNVVIISSALVNVETETVSNIQATIEIIQNI